MFPRRGSSTLVTRWLVVVLVASIIGALDGGWLASWTALAPDRVWRGEIWRLVTWPLIEQGPIPLVLTCAAIYKFGGDLSVRWGERRLRRFVAQIVIGAAVVTCLLAAVTRATGLWRLGGWAMTDALLIAWARQFPNEVLIVYGLLKLRGRELVGVTLGAAILFAIFVGPVTMAPELFACAVAAAYPRGWLQRM